MPITTCVCSETPTLKSSTRLKVRDSQLREKGKPVSFIRKIPDYSSSSVRRGDETKTNRDTKLLRQV